MKCGYYASASITASVAAVILASAVPGPAWADDEYDPSPLCASAAPTPADLAAALSTIKTQIAAEVEVAGGLAVQQLNPYESITHRLDSVQQFSRHDSVYNDGTSASATHHIIDGITGNTYAGHVLGDKGDAGDARGQLALKLLRRSESWIQMSSSDSTMSADAMILAAIDASDLARLEGSATDTAATHVFTCVVNQPADDAMTTAPQLVLTDRYQQTPGPQLLQKYTLEFAPTGALATLRNEVTINAAKTPELRTGTFAYPGATVNPPAVMPARQWDTAVLRASFAALQAHSLTTARAKVRKLSGHAARVAAVRQVAKADAARFFRPAKASSVRDGVSVATATAGGSKATWSYTLRVSGAKVSLRSTLP